MGDSDNGGSAQESEHPRKSTPDISPDSSALSLSRRAALALLGVGGLGLATRSGHAQQTTRSWKTDVDAEAHSLSNLGALGMTDGSTMVREFTGENLSVEDGVLHASGIDHAASLAESPQGEKFGRVEIDDISHTLQVSGTRHQAWMMRPFREPVQTQQTTYQTVGDEIGFGLLPFPPGYAPILRVVGHFTNDPGYTTSLRVSVTNNVPQDDSLQDSDGRRTVLELTGQGDAQVFNEVNLAELKGITTYGKSGSGRNHPNQFVFEMKTGDPVHTATIESSSTVALELEAL